MSSQARDDANQTTFYMSVAERKIVVAKFQTFASSYKAFETLEVESQQETVNHFGHKHIPKLSNK